ncbi:hypothetical protein D3C72_1747200 [compost metagenome]
MLWCLLERLLEIVRAAGIGIGNHEARLVKSRRPVNPKDMPMRFHDLAGHAQVFKAAPRRLKGIGIGRDKDLGDLADNRRHLGHIADPDRAQAAAEEKQDAGQPVQHPGQSLRAIARIDHHQPKVNRLDRAALDLDRHD